MRCALHQLFARWWRRVSRAGEAAVVLDNFRDRSLPATSPTIIREGPVRQFFFFREEPRMHVHVSHPDREAKFWMALEWSARVVVGLSPRQVPEAGDIVRRHLEEIRDAWVRHCGR